MTKTKQNKTIMSFATVLCLVPEMFTGAYKKKREMDWQLVASYFTVKSTDIFSSPEPKAPGDTAFRAFRKEKLFKWSGSHDQHGHHAHIW